MKPNMRIGIGALLAAMLLMGMAFAGAADSSKDLQNESQLHDGKLPDFGPEVFDAIKKDPKVIQTRGTIPKIELENEKREWLHKLDQNGKSIRNQMLPYMQPEGVLVSYGYNYQGYLTVDILEGSEVDETLMDEIYEIFDKQGKRMGIKDVPVVFQFTERPEVESRYSTWRPVFGGIEVVRETGTSTTLCCAAIDPNTGQKGFLVAGHAAYKGGGIGTMFYQPYVSSSKEAGTVDRLKFKYGDAAFVENDMVSVDDLIYYDDTNILKDVSSYYEPEVGWTVFKSGITTGKSEGVITDCKYVIDYIGYPLLFDQYIATYESAPGDSGSPVFRLDGSNVEIVGIHSGSSSDGAIFSPISGIYADLGVVPLTS